MGQGTQNTIVATDLPSFPWIPGDQLYAVPMNNEFITLQNQISNMANQITQLQLQVGSASSNVGFGVTLNWGGGTTISEGPYEVMATAPYDFDINSMDFNVGISGGSFVISVLVNSVPVSGLTNVVVSQAVKITIPVIPTAHVLQGSELVVNISNVIGFPTDCWLSLNGTTAASTIPNPVVAFGTGQAPGSSAMFGNAAVLLASQGLGSIAGHSTMTGVPSTGGHFVLGVTSLNDPNNPLD